jgi:arginine deiminase
MNENKKCTLQIQSETGRLEAVLIHRPGERKIQCDEVLMR